MRFFVPLSRDPEEGENIYGRIRERLKSTKEPPSDRRIYVLRYQQEGKPQTIAVGDDFKRLSDGPVLAILEGGETSKYYVCTPKHGAFEGEPFPIEKDKGIAIEEFSALR
ncbi:MAG: hypothetical protein JOZ62_14310 [Acidobacteriaceae bacterium]|nr:hypothetical protein [Acidobacteriaceae bacterium]